MSKELDRKIVNDTLGVKPKKGEEFTQATVEELSNNKGEDENE